MEQLDYILNQYGRYWHITNNLEVTIIPERSWTFKGGLWGVPKGTIEVVNIVPEHEMARGNAICGQVLCITSGQRWGYQKVSFENGVYTRASRKGRAYYQRGLDHPTLPLCVRCARKAGLAEGTY